MYCVFISQQLHVKLAALQEKNKKPTVLDPRKAYNICECIKNLQKQVGMEGSKCRDNNRQDAPYILVSGLSPLTYRVYQLCDSLLTS